MIYRIAGGIFFVLLAVSTFGVAVPVILTGVAALVAGIALLAGK